MQTSTKLDKYSPNVRKNDIRRHIKSPAIHDTVQAQPISNGIIIKVTSKSAMAKCVNIVSIRDGRLRRRFSSSTNTVILPMDDSTIKMLSVDITMNKRKREPLKRTRPLKILILFVQPSAVCLGKLNAFFWLNSFVYESPSLIISTAYHAQ